MYDDLKSLAITVGDFVQRSCPVLRRDGADNQTWKETLKQRRLAEIRQAFESALGLDVGIHFVETPYKATVGGRGGGKNVLTCNSWGHGGVARTITVLADVVDGSWNAASDLPWSASTMLAFTGIEPHPKPITDLTLSDFKCAVIIPLVGSWDDPDEAAGFYYGVAGEPPHYRVAASTTEYALHPTDVTDVQLTRFFLDLFTAETYESLAISIDMVKPLIYEWGDIGRFYGAGIELMSLLGRPGTTPGFGGYVAANQKADNLIPTKMLLEGAGLMVTDWWGAPIDQMKIMDRAYVAIAASAPLHAHMLRHLSKATRKLQEPRFITVSHGEI